VLESVFVRDVLNQPVKTFALLQTAFGLGLVGTGTALSSLRRYLESTSRMGPVIFAAGVAAAIYAATPVLAVTFAASAAWGTCVALFSPPSRTLLLQQTPAEIHGRVRSQQPRSAPARAGVSRPRRHWHAGEPYRVRRPPGGRRARCRGRLLAKPGSRER
jgi:hypothetical protein